MSWSTHRALQVASDRIVKQEDQIQRALQVLQKAQRYELHFHVLGIDMRPDNSGDWIPIDDVVRAIDILQEGQQ